MKTLTPFTHKPVTHRCTGSLAWLLIGAWLLSLAACATHPKLESYQFSYDAFRDSPDSDILDYRFGTEKYVVWKANEDAVRRGGPGQATGINGPMPRGDTLYVKWRLKSTGVVHEQTVDLRGRLPADLTGHTIHFVAKGAQLYVYLVLPGLRPDNWPVIGPRFFEDYRVLAIYPEHSIDPSTRSQ